MIKQVWNTSLAHYIYRCSAVLTRMQIYVDLSLALSRCSSGFDSDGCVQTSDSCKLGAILSFRPLIKTPRWFKCHKRAALNFRRKKNSPPFPTSSFIQLFFSSSAFYCRCRSHLCVTCLVVSSNSSLVSRFHRMDFIPLKIIVRKLFSS